VRATSTLSINNVTTTAVIIQSPICRRVVMIEDGAGVNGRQNYVAAAAPNSNSPQATYEPGESLEFLAQEGQGADKGFYKQGQTIGYLQTVAGARNALPTATSMRQIEY